jgi:polar amino acid transport system substrate-binding protein
LPGDMNSHAPLPCRLRGDVVVHRTLSAILALLCATCVPVASAALTLTTEDYPPFNMQDPASKTITGISADKVVELMHRAKEPYTLDIFPWSRAYQSALLSKETCVFSTTRTPEREALFSWVGPLVRNNWVVFARADDQTHPKTLDDLRPFIVGGYKDDAVGEFLKEQGINVDPADHDDLNPMKLSAGRVGYWATGELMGRYEIAKAGLADKIVMLFKFKQTELYLACNSNVSPQKIEKLNKILQQMDRDGTSLAIERKYQ